jgi:DNA-binding CsgD family transcriptional regulator
VSWPVPARRQHLLELYCKGLTFGEIAADYGGTPHGVRSTIRKMRERGDAPDRRRVLGGKSKWVVG